jgi:hypothetical protein
MKFGAFTEGIVMTGLLALLAFQWEELNKEKVVVPLAGHQAKDAGTTAGTANEPAAELTPSAAARGAEDFETAYGMHVPASQLKEAWECSLVMISGDRRPHGLGPGVSLPLDIAPEMGLTTKELAILNRHAMTAVEQMQAYEKANAQVESGREGDFWRIPAYPEERNRIMAEFQRRVLAEIGERAASAIAVVAASPHLTGGETSVTVSAVREADGSSSVQIGRSATENTRYRETSGAYDSDAGIFAISRYSHVMNFAAIERKK